MKNKILTLALISFSLFSNAQVKVQSLAVESRINPMGVEMLNPRFSWQLSSDVRNTMQSAYELAVTDADQKAVWNSGRVESDQSVFVPYEGPALKSGAKYYWRVRVW